MGPRSRRRTPWGTSGVLVGSYGPFEPIGTPAVKSLMGDLAAARRQHEPTRAEGHETLTVRLARLRVLRERVQRMAVVGDLPRSVRTTDRAKFARAYAAPGARPPFDAKGRPELRAFARACAFAAGVLLEEIERPSARVDEDLPKPRIANFDGLLGGADRRKPRTRGRRGPQLRGGAGDGERGERRERRTGEEDGEPVAGHACSFVCVGGLGWRCPHGGPRDASFGECSPTRSCLSSPSGRHF